MERSTVQSCLAAPVFLSHSLSDQLVIHVFAGRGFNCSAKTKQELRARTRLMGAEFRKPDIAYPGYG
jgi:hypothetical protein